MRGAACFGAHAHGAVRRRTAQCCAQHATAPATRAVHSHHRGHADDSLQAANASALAAYKEGLQTALRSLALQDSNPLVFFFQASAAHAAAEGGRAPGTTAPARAVADDAQSKAVSEEDQHAPAGNAGVAGSDGDRGSAATASRGPPLCSAAFEEVATGWQHRVAMTEAQAVRELHEEGLRNIFFLPVFSNSAAADDGQSHPAAVRRCVAAAVGGVHTAARDGASGAECHWELDCGTWCHQSSVVQSWSIVLLQVVAALQQQGHRNPMHRSAPRIPGDE